MDGGQPEGGARCNRRSIVRLGLLLAACIGVAFLARFLRHRIRSSRAARHGGYPPEPTRIWIAPLAAIAVFACWSAVGTYVQVHHQTPQTRLAKQLERQSKVQHAFTKELARPPARPTSISTPGPRRCAT